MSVGLFNSGCVPKTHPATIGEEKSPTNAGLKVGRVIQSVTNVDYRINPPPIPDSDGVLLQHLTGTVITFVWQF